MQLKDYQQLATHGARDVALCQINGMTLLAIPQLACDIVGDPANMNGGDSDVEVLIYQWQDDQFHEYQRIPSHGNEHVCFHQIDGRHFLAVASIRSGKQPNFKMNIQSRVYEWRDQQFQAFQAMDTVAAKACLFFSIEGQHFLGFSEGVQEPGADAKIDCASHLYRWDGERFTAFQALPSTWGYNMSYYELEGRHLLAIADNLSASSIYEWDGKQFQSLQTIGEQGGGRHLCFFNIDGQHYLAFANLLHDSTLYRWDDQRFVCIQNLSGVAARQFYAFQYQGDHYLCRTNFISGTREQPITAMDSIMYRWQQQQFQPALRFATCGGTAATSMTYDGKTLLIVSNSLSKAVRFATPSSVYTLI